MCLVHRKFFGNCISSASNSHIFARPLRLNNISFSCIQLVMTAISSDYWPCASPCAEEGPKDGAPSPFGVLQEQFKFVYDTLEEYVVCGTSFFYVQELSERLKAKSLKDKKTKKHPNEYEKEYSVSHSCACFSRKIPPELKKKTGEASPKYKGNHSCLGCCPVIVAIAPLGNCKFLPNLCAPTFTLDPTGNHLEKRLRIDKAWAQMEQMSVAESLYGAISVTSICLLAVWNNLGVSMHLTWNIVSSPPIQDIKVQTDATA